jgi:RNA polymerase sigma-70 factor (ECF subfamily)
MPSASSPQSADDSSLVQQSRTGCVDSFEQLVHRYEARVFHYVRSGCRSDADAKDVTQVSFVAAYLGLDRFELGRPFSPWLFQIARRKLVDHQRGRPFEPLESAPESIEPTEPGQLLAEREEQQSLWQEMQGVLSEKQFAALWFRYREEMSVEEVATAMGISLVHAKVTLFRARQALLNHWRPGREPRTQSRVGQPPSPSRNRGVSRLVGSTHFEEVKP